MKGKITRTQYKDIPALALESGELRALFLSEYGGKLASLIRLKSGREYLTQAPGERYIALSYDGDYEAAECSGFDDMLPTIDACYYERYPWQGVRLPDHGEVCSLRWSVSEDGEGVALSVHGVRLPYTMEKRICFESEDTLRIDYRLINHSSFDMDYLWAAHAMFCAEENGELIVPYPDGSETICTFSREGKYGDRWTWPVTKTRAGTKVMNRTGPFCADGDSFKVFFRERMPTGHMEYRYPSDGTAVIMEVPPDTVPYFSVWVNGGEFHGLHNVAFEPCTGAFDRPDTARLQGMNSILKANGQVDWTVKLSIMEVSKIRRPL